MLVPDTARLACQGTEPTGATAPPTILEMVVIELLGAGTRRREGGKRATGGEGLGGGKVARELLGGRD